MLSGSTIQHAIGPSVFSGPARTDIAETPDRRRRSRPGLIGTLIAGALLTAWAPVGAQEVAETEVRFRSGDVELVGVLRVPASASPVPGVLFLPGGGRQFLRNEPTWFALQLAQRGVASLVFDKRGTGDSGGDWSAATFDDFVADAGAAVQELRRSLEPGAAIGVMGFSQGGRLAPVVAVANDLTAAVSVSGPQTSVGRTRLYALERSMSEAGLSPASIDAAMALWREHIDLVRENGELSTLDSRVSEARRWIHRSALPPLSNEFTPSPIFNSMAYNGVDSLNVLRAPYLAIFGENDLVVPVTESVEVLERALRVSGNTQARVIVIRGSAHGINDASGQRHPDYPGPVMDWFVQQLRGGSGSGG